MEIKNNTPANQCIVVHGQPTLLIPGDGTLYLPDSQWPKYVDECENLLAAKNLEVSVEPTLSDAEQEEALEAELERMRAAVKEADEKAAKVAKDKEAARAALKP